MPHPFLGWEGGVSWDGSVDHNFNDPAPVQVTFDYTFFQDTLILDTMIIDTTFVELADGSNCAIAADVFCDTPPDYLAMGDIDLDKGQIYVRETVKTNARTLPLKAEQVMFIYRYLSEYRARFIKQQTEALIISGRGQAELGEGVHYLVTTMRKVIPNKKLTPMTIRQSVIANKLKAGQDLRIVQVFAGHRQPSSTEAYRTNKLEELRTAVAKYHPLG